MICMHHNSNYESVEGGSTLRALHPGVLDYFLGREPVLGVCAYQSEEQL